MLRRGLKVLAPAEKKVLLAEYIGYLWVLSGALQKSAREAGASRDDADWGNKVRLSDWAWAPIRVSVESELGVPTAPEIAMGFEPVSVTAACWARVGWLADSQGLQALSRKCFSIAYTTFKKDGVSAGLMNASKYFVSYVVGEAFSACSDASAIGRIAQASSTRSFALQLSKIHLYLTSFGSVCSFAAS